MGIKGLSNLLKDHTEIINLSDLSNKTLVIDTSIYMYKFMYMSNSYEFINKFRFQIKNFKKYNITPIYIFDGVSPKLKQDLKDKRKLTKNIIITKENVVELKQMLKDQGVSHFTAPHEGEKYCAYINRQGYADYVLSNDLDTLLFNCTDVITLKGFDYTLYNLENILTKLDILFYQLIDIGIASGCDYATHGIKGLGPKKSLNLSKEHLTNFLSKYQVDFDIEEVKRLFLNFDDEKEAFELIKDTFLK